MRPEIGLYAVVERQTVEARITIVTPQNFFEKKNTLRCRASTPKFDALHVRGQRRESHRVIERSVTHYRVMQHPAYRRKPVVHYKGVQPSLRPYNVPLALYRRTPIKETFCAF